MDEQTHNAHRLLQLFEAMRGMRPGPGIMRLNELGLSWSHMRALHLLATEDPLAMKDLAERLCLTPPSVTALARRLVQSGLVQRTAATADSRVALLSLTPEGTALLQQIYHDHLQRMTRLLQGLTIDEQQLFLDLLERAVQAMQVTDDRR